MFDDEEESGASEGGDPPDSQPESGVEVGIGVPNPIAAGGNVATAEDGSAAAVEE